MKNLNKLLLATIVVSAISCQSKQRASDHSEAAHQTNQPEHEVTTSSNAYLIEDLDHGTLQSPINIITKQTASYETHSVALHYQKSEESITNLGHTIQVEYDSGNTVDFDENNYELKQFHFHTPSEHLINGMTFPMEMHLVHTLKSGDPNDMQYLVIGVLFMEGEENSFLNEFISAIPKKQGEHIEDHQTYVNVNDLFAAASSLEYYNYQGSLTTAPYTESVQWLVVKHVFEASPEQIVTFNALEGNNARHVQALYGRKINSL